MIKKIKEIFYGLFNQNHIEKLSREEQQEIIRKIYNKIKEAV